MLTKTSLTAARLLIYLGLEAKTELASLKQIARELNVSPTYLMKIGRRLVKAGILRASRGKAGGVVLNRSPQDITLLDAVEACQGKILGDFCEQTDNLRDVCAFHRAGAELHDAITGVRSRWRVAEFVVRPLPTGALRGRTRCLLRGWIR